MLTYRFHTFREFLLAAMANPRFVYVLFCSVLMQFTWGAAKMCTNTYPQLASHSYRYAVDSSKNETWKAQVYSHDHDHLVPTDDSEWARLLPPRRKNAEENFKWAMFYRRMRYNMDVNVSLSSKPQNKNNFLEEVPLHKVRLVKDSLHGSAQHTNLEYLLLLDVDSLVWSFRKTAGLPTPGSPYGGWEAPTSELRGHFVGHFMSSSAMTWAATQDETIHQRMTALVSALHECQQAMGTGYLSAFPEELFYRFESLVPVWAPYYTIHKIMAGLLDQYTFGENAQAYNMTVWMAEYFHNRVQNVIKQYSIERHWDTLNDEVGGMNDVLYRLYTLSGDQKHLQLAHLFDKPCFLGLLAIQADNIAGLHTNTHIPIVVGAQMRYEITGEPLYKDMSTFFMEIINSSHSYATGGTSVYEFWNEPNRIATQLDYENEESCTTYNMLKVARHLFRWTKEMAYADYYERALTNGVLSIQRGTEPGVMIYMLPQGQGVSKARSYHGWGSKYNDFWCCYGTATESFAKLGDAIYFQEKGAIPNLYIIQFIASAFTWDAIGFTLKQAVQQVSSLDPYLRVSLEFSALGNAKAKNKESSINIRIPFWTAKNARAMLNAQELSLPYPGNFLTIKRKWISGDKVSLTFPIGLRTETIKDDRDEYQSVQAILFGPYLLAGMTDGDWDLQIGKTFSLSDWITPIPASQLFTFGQERKISGLHQTKNNTQLVLRHNKTQIIMDQFPMLGTDEAAHATFTIVDWTAPNRKANSLMDLVGNNVYIELFDRPGMVITHQGIDNSVIISHRFEAESTEDSATSTIFKLRAGLDGNKNSISFESVKSPSCFLYGGTSYQVGQVVRLRCIPKTKDFNFNSGVSFNANMGTSTYHPISFIARGSNNNYLLAPLLAFKDESYTVYFNITV